MVCSSARHDYSVSQLLICEHNTSPQWIPSSVNISKFQELSFRACHTSANMQNDKGQGVSHANDSKLPQQVQKKVRVKFRILQDPSSSTEQALQALSTRSQTRRTTRIPTRIPVRCPMPLATAKYRRCCKKVSLLKSRRRSPMPFMILVARISERVVYYSMIESFESNFACISRCTTCSATRSPQMLHLHIPRNLAQILRVARQYSVHSCRSHR